MKNKKKTSLPSIVRVVGILIVITIVVTKINLNNKRVNHIEMQAKEFYKKSEKIRKIAQPLGKTDIKKNENVQKVEKIVQNLEIAQAEYEEPIVEKSEDNSEIVEEVNETEQIEENENIVQSSYTTRMTSYYPEEGESITGSGLGPNDFGVNEFGWFTYNGKLVVAAATEYLLKYGFSLAEGVHTYRYFDEITLNIDGIDYSAIVLDSCGSSMKTDRIDLFVSGSWAVKDTQIIVKQ